MHLYNESGSKSLAVKQAPYSNKANVEDLGNNPLKISIEAIFSGENYKIEMDALWAALVATGSGELILISARCDAGLCRELSDRSCR